MPNWCKTRGSTRRSREIRKDPGSHGSGSAHSLALSAGLSISILKATLLPISSTPPYPTSAARANWALQVPGEARSRVALLCRGKTWPSDWPLCRSKLGPHLQMDPGWKRAATHLLKPSLHGQVSSKLNGTVCMECPMQRIPEPICNKDKGGIN